MGREEFEKDREREEKRETVNIHGGKAVLQMTAVSERWTWCKAACESRGPHAGHRLGSRHRGSKMERRLASTGEHRGAGSPESPPWQAKAEGWDAGGGEVARRGKEKWGGLRLPVGLDATQTDLKAREMAPLQPEVCGCGGAWHNWGAPVNPWVAEKKRGWPGAMGSSLRRASLEGGVDKMGAGLRREIGQW